MRTTTLTALTLILFASCSRYQYVTVDSPDASKDANHEFVEENDSIRIRYSFNGMDAPISLTIENKLDVPVFVDWQQSSLIVNDRAISYRAGSVPFEANISGGPGRGLVFASGNLNGIAGLPLGVDFIPPHSYLSRSPMGLTNQFVTDVPDSIYGRKKVPREGGSPVSVKHASFTPGSSPLQFSSYLTLMFGEKSASPVAFEHSFYISEIYSTGLGPTDFWYGNSFRGDQYCVKKTTAFGKGFGIVGGIALLSAVDALNLRLQQDCGQPVKHRY